MRRRDSRWGLIARQRKKLNPTLFSVPAHVSSPRLLQSAETDEVGRIMVVHNYTGLSPKYGGG